jgi:5'-nucleotidase
VHIVIGLSHSGLDRDIEIAEAIPELSLIVGAHSHTLLFSPAGSGRIFLIDPAFCEERPY